MALYYFATLRKLDMNGGSGGVVCRLHDDPRCLIVGKLLGYELNAWNTKSRFYTTELCEACKGPLNQPPRVNEASE